MLAHGTGHGVSFGGKVAGDSTPGGGVDNYIRPDGASVYRRPDGTSLYKRP